MRVDFNLITPSPFTCSWRLILRAFLPLRHLMPSFPLPTIFHADSYLIFFISSGDRSSALPRHCWSQR